MTEEIHCKFPQVSIKTLGNRDDLASTQERTVAAAVSRAAHAVSMAALLSPAAGEAAGRGVLRAVAVSSHHALFVTAAWIALRMKKTDQIQPFSTYI